MDNILLIGKGALFSSVVNYSNRYDTDDSITILLYEQFLYLQSSVKEIKDFQEITKLCGYMRVYLFPESLTDGIICITFLPEWFLGTIFVVTQDYGSNFLYKKLGADYVIMSRPNCRTYHWFPKQ